MKANQGGWRRQLAFAATAWALALGTAQVQATEPLPEEAAQLINAIRATTLECGDHAASGAALQRVALPASLPRPNVTWNPRLAAAAQEHASAMAEQNFFSHTDPQGRNVAYRVSTTGYSWHTVGENLAAGQRTLEETMRNWLLSEAHCRNLLDERFIEFGIARVGNTSGQGRYKVYWALVLGRPSAALHTAALDTATLQR